MTSDSRRFEANATTSTWSRRKALPLLSSVAVSAFAIPINVLAQEATPTSDASVATMPDWRLTLVSMTDPYTGQITKPESLPSSVRVVSCEVIISNGSSQPLEFQVSDIRLRDSDGVEYRAGQAIGVEPRIVSQNLPDGERTRGWVWFEVPNEANVTSLVFICPAPILKVPLE